HNNRRGHSLDIPGDALGPPRPPTAFTARSSPSRCRRSGPLRLATSRQPRAQHREGGHDMSLIGLARTHARVARRQKALWFTAIPLTAFATLIAVVSPRLSGSGEIDDLASTGEII